MAKFNNNTAEGVHNRPLKVVTQPSSAAKAAFEKFNKLETVGAPPRPSSLNKSPLKPPLGVKPSLQNSSDQEPKPPPWKSTPVAAKVAALSQASGRETNEKPAIPKPLGPKPTEGIKEDSKPGFLKPQENKFQGPALPKNEIKPPVLRPTNKSEVQENVPKPVFPNIAGVKEKFSAASQENDPKPPVLKPVMKQKPSPSSMGNEEASNKNQATPSTLGLRPKANLFQPAKETEEKKRDETSPTPSPFGGVTLKQVGNHSNVSQGLQKAYGQQNEERRPSVARFGQENSGSVSSTPPANFIRPSGVAVTGSWTSNLDKEGKDKTLPKRKALPPLFKLGPAPQKPSRPPAVDLDKFRIANRGSPKESHAVNVVPPHTPSASSVQATATQPQPPPPPPPSSHPSAQAPVLPPRNIKPRVQENEEKYDDVEFGSGGTGGESQNSDGEMYEDVSDVRSTHRDDGKKKEKEERKIYEKKEQKEKDKKEQDIRKKYKLVGPIEVIHQGRTSTDFKGGKNDLSFKQGDHIEIIRITDNPEGKWLARLKGSYGYIKNHMVEIDYDSLKRKPRTSISVRLKQPDSDQDVYDDVGDEDSISSAGPGTSGVGFPSPPDEVYDGVEGVEDDEVQTGRSVSQGEDRSDSWPRGLLKILKRKDYEKKSVRETTTKINLIEDNGSSSASSVIQTGKDSGDSDVYDDVDAADFPPPPKEIHIGINTKSLSFGRLKSDERDSQKLKKKEKEEKDFRKKFKYDGDIRVLYKTTITRAPSPKKKGSKDLLVKPGESVDVIQDVDDTKVLCRNEEGKYGYVRRSCIVNDDEEIYDDIADDCVYDNE